MPKVIWLLRLFVKIWIGFPSRFQGEGPGKESAGGTEYTGRRTAVIPYALTLSLTVLPGCVIGRIQPRHFQFTTIVEKTENGPDGWRAACIHAQMKNGTTGDTYICRFGVEMPIENADGPISTPLAQRIAADCANSAAELVLGSATRETGLGLACESFKTTYQMILNATISGSRVKTQCHPKTKPVKFAP